MFLCFFFVPSVSSVTQAVITENYFIQLSNLTSGVWCLDNP